MPNTSALHGLENELLCELFSTFPLARVHPLPQDEDNELHIRGSFNNLYPTVLRVLARKVEERMNISTSYSFDSSFLIFLVILQL